MKKSSKKLKRLCILCMFILSFFIIISCSESPAEAVNSNGNASDIPEPVPPPVLTIYGDELSCTVNDETVTLTTKCYSNNGHVFVPVVDVLPHLGYSIGWDADLNAVTLLKNGVVSYLFPKRNNIWAGPTEHIFDYKPLTVEGRSYMSEEMFSAFTSGGIVKIDSVPGEYKDGMSILYSERRDDYRLPGNSILFGGNVHVIDGFGMELPSINESGAKAYANTITEVALSLDENINVYNIVVPTAAEFYAPLSHYPNQLHGIQKVYENLGDRVIPINIYDTLGEHAAEHIYFKTDHHWTQRGAYYAYKEFMSYDGVEVPSLDTFENVPSDKFVGSFATFARGTAAGNVMKSSPELLERFVPKYADSGKVYATPALEYWGTSYKAVNTQFTSYSAFIGGDNPIIIFDTTAESDRTLVIIKESYGNAFATWALNDYKRVCVIDPRRFNGFGGNNVSLNLNSFCQSVGATDVMFINYPIAVMSPPIRNSIAMMK